MSASATIEASEHHRTGGRLLVVSHPCVVAENQSVYLALEDHGWSTTIVVPALWRHAYAMEPVAPQVLPGLEGRIVPLRVALAGRPQRHFYLARPSTVVQEVLPDVVFVEQESFSIAMLQWGAAAARAGIPFGVQAAENLDRQFPLPARMIRRWALSRAAFVAARSERAGELARRQGAVGEVTVVPHAIPGWVAQPRQPGDRFTVGFAGRLVPEKGVRDLADAMRLLGTPVRLLLVGDGSLAAELGALSIPNVEIELQRDLGHAGMPAAYARMDVLVLPSRTTPKWTEQFGRVLVEALFCGTPVIGSDSGEIPWVISNTGGGRVYPEGDVSALAAALQDLMADDAERRRLAERGRIAAVELFSVEAVARTLDQLLVRSSANVSRWAT